MTDDRFRLLLGAKYGFLTALIAAAIAFFYLVLPAEAQESFTVHSSTVLYGRPDAAQWRLMNDGIDANSKAYLVMFKRTPIKDAEGREIEPVMAIICESVPSSTDVIQYSIAKRVNTPFQVNSLLTPQQGYFTHKNSVGYQGEYKRGSVLHKVLIGHLRNRDVGVQVICDSTDGVYDKVEADMLGLLRSITFQE